MKLTEKSRLSKMAYDKRCPSYAFRIKDEKKAMAIEEYRKTLNLTKQEMGEIMYSCFVKHNLEIVYKIPFTPKITMEE